MIGLPTCRRKLKATVVLEAQSLSRVRLFATPWTVACHGPLSMGFRRQGYWRGLPFPPPGDLWKDDNGKSLEKHCSSL